MKCIAGRFEFYRGRVADAGEWRVVGRILAQRDAQKVAERERIAAPPGDAALRVESLEAPFRQDLVQLAIEDMSRRTRQLIVRDKQILLLLRLPPAHRHWLGLRLPVKTSWAYGS